MAWTESAAPKAKDVKAIFDAAGIDSDATKLDALIAAMDGKTVEEVMAEGSKKLATLGSGGGGGGAAAPAAAGGAAAPAAAAAAPVEEEEEDDDMGMSLFD